MKRHADYEQPCTIGLSAAKRDALERIRVKYGFAGVETVIHNAIARYINDEDHNEFP